MLKCLTLSMIFCGFFVPSHAESKKAPSVNKFDHEHKQWDRLLKEHVKDGFVSYREIAKKDNRKYLEKYLYQLSSVKKKQFKKFSLDEKLAFLINAYNAFAVKLIIDSSMVGDKYKKLAGIKKINLGFLSLFKSPFKKKFIPLNIGNKKLLSLDNIEHDHLRKLKQPLIHFGIVCASKSCPSLISEAYTAKKVMAQLKQAGQQFLADTSKNKLVPGSEEEPARIYLSMIFKWFKKDFGKNQEELLAFLAPYMPEAMKKASTKSPIVRHMNYDWSLNGH